MKFGLHLGTRGVASTAHGLATMAKHAEARGFAHIGFSDHVVIARDVESPYPYTADGKWFAQDTGFCLEQLSVLSYVAAVTTRIRLVTSVMVLPYREPILANKMITTVDVLSQGRVTVGLGAGWMEEEMNLLSSPPFAARGRVANEYIEAFKVLWTESAPKYAGEFVSFDNLLAEPKPVQRPHPPIWVGGETRPARRRAGQLGDGWYPVINNPAAPMDTAERYGAALAQTKDFAAAADRDPSALDAGLLAIWYQLDDRKTFGAKGSDRKCFTGTAQAIIADIAAYAEAGLEHLVIGFESNDLAASMGRVDEFAEHIMPHFE
ncbi:MAG: LLM class F420-dependent oxidoreductase [Gammaproteobacteria bacterium]|nr:LLM class F420-dependent oxidoreductase [Gammaproteobacteria bacterium]